MLMQEMQAAAESAVRISHVAGVVDSSEIARLRRLIFRTTRGKSYMFTQQIEVEEEDVKPGK
jgi:hypothetical protein